MASTVKIPLLGQHSKGTVIGVTIGGFAVAGFMIYRYESKSKKQAAAVASAQASANYGYGSAGSYGYGGGYGYGISNGYYGYGEPGTGYYGYGVPAPQAPTQAAASTTNAQWAQAAITQLTQEGYDPSTVSAALGAYELGQPVTATQVPIIQSAIGIEGWPPVPGASGYPPGIMTQGTPGGGSGGGQGGGSGGGTGGGSGGGTVTTAGLYWHAELKYFTNGSVKVSAPSGIYNIGGQNYYWHSVLRYFTLNGKKASPPSGPATPGSSGGNQQKTI
jgi:hypothetical protein